VVHLKSEVFKKTLKDLELSLTQVQVHILLLYKGFQLNYQFEEELAVLGLFINGVYIFEIYRFEGFCDFWKDFA
jgi:hypothetical protein